MIIHKKNLRFLLTPSKSTSKCIEQLKTGAVYIQNWNKRFKQASHNVQSGEANVEQFYERVKKCVPISQFVIPKYFPFSEKRLQENYLNYRYFELLGTLALIRKDSWFAPKFLQMGGKEDVYFPVKFASGWEQFSYAYINVDKHWNKKFKKEIFPVNESTVLVFRWTEQSVYLINVGSFDYVFNVNPEIFEYCEEEMTSL